MFNRQNRFFKKKKKQCRMMKKKQKTKKNLMSARFNSLNALPESFDKKKP